MSDVIAGEVAPAEVRNKLTQIWWRINANNRIQSPTIKKEHAWIKEGEYWESIVKVIGAAIGDCVTGENEFNGTTGNDIITFADTDPSDYDRENWNAVFLYNYVNRVIRSNQVETIDDCCYDINQNYAKRYPARKQGEISLSIQDMKAYCEALHLQDMLVCVRKSASAWKRSQSLQNASPLELKPAVVLDDKTKIPSFESNDSLFAVGTKLNHDKCKIFNCSLTFQCLRGKLFVSQIKSSTVAHGIKEGGDYKDKMQDTSLSETNILDEVYKEVFELLDGLIEPTIPQMAK